MNYTIISKTGWKAGAYTQDEAIAKALDHRRQWAEVGRDIQVDIYYFGMPVMYDQKGQVTR